MRRRAAGVLAAGVFAWVAMVTFGAVLVETFLIYPNVFHDVPRSLAGAMEFFVVTGPADVFPPLGAATGVAAVAAVVALWRRAPAARWWAAAGLGSLLVGEFLFSMLFFWPRNEVMFEEGLAVHSVEALRQAAAEFQAGHWVRLAMSGLTASLAFVAALRSRRTDGGARRGVELEAEVAA